MKNAVLRHIKLNIREYILVSATLILGVIIGIIFINCTSDIQKEEISNYITNLTDFIKTNPKIDKIELLIESLKQNIFLLFLIWFFGCTVVGSPIIYLLVMYRGFCLGYSLSSMVAVYSGFKGILLIFLSLFFQNIIFIPAIFLISVSGIKLYQAIMRTRTKENIKVEIIKHTIFLVISIILGIISTFIEVLISTNLLILAKGIF